MKAWGYHAR